MAFNDPYYGNTRDSMAQLAAHYKGNTRDSMAQLAAHYKGIIQQLASGQRPVEIPWSDPRFQEMVIHLIGDQLEYKTDSDKLAVIREVFGGK